MGTRVTIGGYFTTEAAVVFPLMFFVYFFFMLLIFKEYDKALLFNRTATTIIDAKNKNRENENEFLREIEGLFADNMGSLPLLSASSVEGTVNLKRNTLSLDSKVVFTNPVLKLFIPETEEKTEITTLCSLKMTDPVENMFIINDLVREEQ